MPNILVNGKHSFKKKGNICRNIQKNKQQKQKKNKQKVKLAKKDTYLLMIYYVEQMDQEWNIYMSVAQSKQLALNGGETPQDFKQGLDELKSILVQNKT